MLVWDPLSGQRRTARGGGGCGGGNSSKKAKKDAPKMSAMGSTQSSTEPSVRARLKLRLTLTYGPETQRSDDQAGAITSNTSRNQTNTQPNQFKAPSCQGSMCHFEKM